MQFEITGKDCEKVEKFIAQHKNCPMGSAGDHFTYTFIPTGIGMATTVTCSCGQKILLGEFSNHEPEDYDEEKYKVLTKEDIDNKEFEDLAVSILNMKNSRVFPNDGQSDKQNNGESNRPNDGESDTLDNDSSESAQNEGEQKDIPEAELVDSISTKAEELLSNAVEIIQDKVPDVQPGPYVQISQVQGDEGNKENENQQFTIKILDELVKEDRTYYLVKVDDNGNIVILQNEDIKDGVLTFTGKSNSIYQMLYEDTTVYLAGMLNENGYLADENGDAITVDMKYCFWHYIIIVLALIGITLLLFFRDKRKNQLLTVAIVTILMLILIIAGWCKWDVLFAILAEVIMAVFIILSKNKQKDVELE